MVELSTTKTTEIKASIYTQCDDAIANFEKATIPNSCYVTPPVMSSHLF
jgi:hypothetical protein